MKNTTALHCTVTLTSSIDGWAATLIHTAGTVTIRDIDLGLLWPKIYKAISRFDSGE